MGQQFFDGIEDKAGLLKAHITENISAGNECCTKERRLLESKYSPLLDITCFFNRKIVSYQLSKKDSIHSWLKYKEGFSAALVDFFLNEMGAKQGAMILDPFMGSGTTALVCQMRGINAIGFDVMPISEVAIKVKSNVLKYNVSEIRRLISRLRKLDLPDDYDRITPNIKITEGAYPEYNAKFLQFVTEWIMTQNYSEDILCLFKLAVLNSLEPCSFTSKDGQYLRWDYRSEKIIRVNKERISKGKKPFKEIEVRKEIQNIKETIISELEHITSDIVQIQNVRAGKRPTATVDFRTNSVLFELPTIQSDSIDGVITSPPYCNRYDYTRTYALELVYLGVNETTIKKMRQDLLSCTVENKSKVELLREYYNSKGIGDRFDYIHETMLANAALKEVNDALIARDEKGDLNNNGVKRMVDGYFTELAFIFAELYRVCKKGAMVVFVNDNVRYGGEVIPVDFLSTSIAEQFGFIPLKIYCLKQQKGNSSQQMAKFGRVAMRKSITVWQK